MMMTTDSIYDEANPIRLVIADDHELILTGIKKILSFSKVFDIVGCASNGKDAIELVKFHKPDILLIDISMPILDGIQTVKQVKASMPNIACVILTASQDRDSIKKSLTAGANGYLSKDSNLKEFEDALIKIQLGERVFSSSILQIVNDIDNESSKKEPTPITKREQEILNFLALGLKTSQIADKLNISSRTVENHRYHIKNKLGLNSSAELIRFAVLHDEE